MSDQISISARQIQFNKQKNKDEHAYERMVRQHKDKAESRFILHRIPQKRNILLYVR